MVEDGTDFVRPEHVPPELAINWDFATAPGARYDPFAALTVLHEGRDIFWAPRVASGNPAWVVTRDSLIREIFQDAQTFSSSKITGFSALMDETFDMIPIEKDPPEHTNYRQLLNPLFAPMRIKEIEDKVLGTAEKLVEAALSEGECEFMEAFARPFPATIFLGLMGLPLDLTKQFLSWEDGLLREPTEEGRRAAARSIRDYLNELIAERRRRPIDDLISIVIQGQVNGRPMNDEEILSICALLFIGGLDTVTATLGFAFRHLAINLDNQQLLREKPELRKNAIEETIRAHPPVNTYRFATKNVVFHDVLIKEGDRIMLVPALSGRDEREFNEPNKIDFRRENIRHIGFGAGPHRCIGSHLARREVGIAFDLWLDRTPLFRLKEGEEVIVESGNPFNVIQLPLTW